MKRQKWSKEELKFLVNKYFDYKNNLIDKKEIIAEFNQKFPERNNLASINLKFYNIEHLAPYITNEFIRRK